MCIFYVYYNISTTEISLRAFIENVEQEDIFGKQDIEHHHCRGRRGLNNLYNVWIIIKSAAKFLRKLIFPEEPPGETR